MIGAKYGKPINGKKNETKEIILNIKGRCTKCVIKIRKRGWKEEDFLYSTLPTSWIVYVD